MNYKKLTALTATLIFLTNTSTFAANNPFTDVPNDHWSFNAIEELAAAGIIEGYGDNTWRGDSHITRYEMAQMVAKAMANNNLSTTDQSTVNKLATEYAVELHNLGVRVSELETKTDNVKISGYTYLRAQSQTIKDKNTGTKNTSSVSRSFTDLIVSGKVNENWSAVLETNTLVDLKNNTGTDTIFAGMSANGKYDNFSTRLGRFDQYSDDGGLVLHGSVNGAEIKFGNKLKTTLTAGRINFSSVLTNTTGSNAFDYQAVELAYPASKATTLRSGFYRLNDDSFAVKRGETSPKIYTAGFQSKLDKNFRLSGYYLKSSSDIKNGVTVKDTGYYANLEYKGPTLGQTDTWGLYLKYAYIPELTQISMDVGHFKDYNGFELGSFYMLAPNTRGHLRYYHGKNVDNGAKTKDLIRAEVRFFF